MRGSKVGDAHTLQSTLRTQRCVVPLAGYWHQRCRAGVETRVRVARTNRTLLLVAGVWHGETTLEGGLQRVRS